MMNLSLAEKVDVSIVGERFSVLSAAVAPAMIDLVEYAVILVSYLSSWFLEGEKKN